MTLSKSRHMKRLDMSNKDISYVEPELLASAVSRLEEVDLRYTILTPQQATSLCLALRERSHMKKLDISYRDLSSVEPGLLQDSRLE